MKINASLAGLLMALPFPVLLLLVGLVWDNLTLTKAAWLYCIAVLVAAVFVTMSDRAVEFVARYLK